jgi:hypothetical protein
LPEFSFVAPLLPGKTEAWRKAVAEMRGPRSNAYKESRKKFGIKREHISLQKTPHGDMVVVHMDAKDPANVMSAMFASTSDFDRWFRDVILVGTHGLDPKSPPPPPPPVEVISDFKG